jgi:hypothetical protein
MSIRKAILSVAFGGLAIAAAHAGTIEQLHEMSAGHDMAELRKQVERLARLAKAEIKARGVEAAMKAFRHAPWRRDANGLHLWGVTNAGLSWFDAGHPELEGLNVSEMSDLHGRKWARLAVASADGSGEKTFEITFPHPTFKSAARGLHNCFRVKKSDRVLCAGAFLDPE